MEISGKIKVLNDTQNFGDNGFRKREVVIATQEQYPQPIMVEFTQDKCELLDNYAIGHDVKISINLRGREWINPEGVPKYFNAIQGWRIELLDYKEEVSVNNPKLEASTFIVEPDNDLPF